MTVEEAAKVAGVSVEVLRSGGLDLSAFGVNRKINNNVSQGALGIHGRPRKKDVEADRSDASNLV